MSKPTVRHLVCALCRRPFVTDRKPKGRARVYCSPRCTELRKRIHDGEAAARQARALRDEVAA